MEELKQAIQWMQDAATEPNEDDRLGAALARVLSAWLAEEEDAEGAPVYMSAAQLGATLKAELTDPALVMEAASLRRESTTRGRSGEDTGEVRRFRVRAIQTQAGYFEVDARSEQDAKTVAEDLGRNVTDALSTEPLAFIPNSPPSWRFFEVEVVEAVPA